MIGLTGCGGITVTPTTTVPENSTPARTTSPTPTYPPAESPTETSAKTPTPAAVDLPWNQLPGPPGGPVTYISVSKANPDRIYAAGRTAGIFVSGDGGSSWIQGFSGQHHRSRVWVSPHDPQTAFNKREWTDNGGRKWHHPEWSLQDRYAPVAAPTYIETDPTETRVYNLEWDPFDERTIYAATPEGLLRTSNGGKSWEVLPIADLELPPGHRGWDLAIHPEQEGLLAAGLGSKVARSTDHGESWSITNLGEQDPRTRGKYIRGVEFAAADSKDVYLASEGVGVFELEGNVLRELTPNLPDLVYPKQDLPLSISANRDTLYFIAGRSSQMYEVSAWWEDRKLYRYDRTTDEVKIVNTSVKPNAVATHPTKESGLFIGGDSWVHASQDSGETWTPLNSGFVDHYLSTVAINQTQPTTSFPGSICSTGVSVSHDRGQTFEWKRSGLGPWHQGEFGEHYVMQIAAAGDRAYTTTAAGLLISPDNGSSWRLMDNRFSGEGEFGGDTAHLHGLAVHPNEPETVYVGTGRGGGGGGDDIFDGAKIWKSRDGGESWKEITDGFPVNSDTTVQDITTDPHDPDTVYAGTNETDYIASGSKGGDGVGLYRSTNAGNSWEKLPTPFENVHAVTVDAAGSDTLYASTSILWKQWREGGVYRSTDGGKSWERILPYVTYALKAHPTKSGVLFAGSRKYQDYWEVLVSQDGGESWAEGNLRIRASNDPADPGLEYDAAELHSNYWGNSSGQIMWFAHDPTNSLLYAATNGVGLWQADTSILV